MGLDLEPSAYTESVYKRWFQQLQKADTVFHKSQDSLIKMTMPEIMVGKLPEPMFFKDPSNDFTFLPKHIMKFMRDPTKATHWLLYSAVAGGRTIRIHIVHYQAHAHELKQHDDSDGGEDNTEAVEHTTSESKGVPLYWLKKYRQHVYKAFAWFQFIAPYTKDCDCSKELDVYLYFTPFKKNLPDTPSSTVGPQHSNTGFTTSCTANLSKNGSKNRTEIIIYRYEEFFKVLLHETMHNLDLDFGHMTDDVTVDHLFPGIKHDIILSETYAETWARLLNVAFYSYYNILGGHGGYKKYQRAVQRCLATERAFSLYQATSVLAHMGLTLPQILSTDPQVKSLVSKKYSEDTNVFAYYILAGLTMLEADLFLQWCKDTNKHNLIQANSGSAGSDALLILIELIVKSSSTSSSLSDAIDIITKMKREIGTTGTTDENTNKSSRMTIW
jgi:hypothetical protein